MRMTRKIDPMNGHVELPWFYFLTFLLMAVLCLGLFLLSIYSGTSQPKPEDLSAFSVRFQSYEVRLMQKSTSTSLRLYGEEDPRPYTLDFFEGYDTWIPDPAQLCDGNAYQVEVIENRDFYSIYTITAPNGTPILTYENHEQGYQNSQGTAILILRIFSLLGMIYFSLGILFTRHPEKYPRWMERLYYKRGILR